MKLFDLCLLLLLSLQPLYSQSGWQNPADRYKEAYKEFLDEPQRIAEDDRISHYVYFARDREKIRGHAFLAVPRFDGAQLMYSWRELEPRKGEYDFSAVLADLEYLESHGKKLFIQLQDATFMPTRLPVPDYLLAPEFGGGAVRMLDDSGSHEGWAARRWNPNVRERYALLLQALGREFDGRIEGINLQESAAAGSAADDPTYSHEAYAEALRENMTALGSAFSKSVTMQYANFMPGEWLPWEDEGYLRSLYEHGEAVGVGLGAPDLMVKRRGQLNHALAMMHEGEYTVPLGIAVQDGNYIGETGTLRVDSERKSIVPTLHGFARDFLKVDYMFWSFQEPYFSEDVLPFFE